MIQSSAPQPTDYVHGDYIIYGDESGDLSLQTIYPFYPVFVLALCIFPKQRYVVDGIKPLKDFKFTFWGHDMTILHSWKIRRQIEDFNFLQGLDKRQYFAEALETALQNSLFTIIATGIDKYLLKEQEMQPINLYEISLEHCMLQVYRFLEEKQQHGKVTHLVIESRMKKENGELETAFQKLIEKYRELQSQFPLRLIFADKKANNIGLQIADLVAYPIGQEIVFPEKENRSFDVVKEKFHKYPEYKGSGLTILPYEKSQSLLKSERPRISPKPDAD